MRTGILVLVGVVALLVAAEDKPKADFDTSDKLPKAARTILAKPDKLVLYSLAAEETAEKVSAFHGWKQLGKTEVTAEETRKKLLTGLKKSLDDDAKMAKCFEPRHGIRATRDGKTVDLVICYACGQVYVHLPDVKPGDPVRLTIHAGGEKGLDAILEAAKVPLAPKKE